MAGGGGGGRRWQDEVEPELRPRVIHQSVAKVAELYRGANKSLPDGLQEHVGNVEMDTFMTAEDRMDYLRRMSLMVRIFQQQTKLQPAADHQQQMQMAHQIQRANTVQAIQGGNSSFTAIPRAVSTMDVQSMNQHMMTRPFASNDMQINVNQGPSDMMAMLYQPLNSQPATVAPVAQSVQCGQQIMQQIAMQSDNQRLAMQLHPTNVARCHQASMAQLQGQPIAVPNGHHNHLLSPNVCAYPQHLQPTVRQQHFGISQQQVGMQRCQMLGANVANMNNGNHSGGWNNQQNTGWASGIQSPLNAHKQVALKRQTNMESQSMAPAQRQIAVNQQTNMHCPSQQNQAKMGSAREVNWRDEMVQQIKSLKDAYYSELMELDQNHFVQRLTEEQFKSLTKEKADTYSRMVNNKSCIGDILKFLQLEKSLDTYRGKLPVYQEAIHHLISYHRKRKANAEMITRQESKSCPRQPPPQTINLTADIAPFTDGKSNQQKLLADESIGQTRQNVVTTPSAGQKTHSNQLQGVTSPSFSIKSPGPLQSSPINDVVLCCTTSPVNKSTVPSPNSLVMKSRSQSPIAKPGVGEATSSCASVKSTLTSTVEKLFLAADSPCASVKSASPCASVKSACFSNRSPGALQSSPINDFVSCCTTPPTDKLRVPSPNSLLKPGSQSPIAKPGVGAVASPCMSVKSTLTSTVEEKAGFLAASLPCASVKSASPSATAKSSSDSNSSFLLHNNAAVNGSNQTSLSKLLTPDPPFQKQTPAGQAEEQEHGGSDIPVAKKPIDRLTAAVFSLSPAVLRSSVNLMESALRAMDSVPLRIGSNNEMKRVYDLTLPSESNVTLGSMDESTMTFESDALGSASSRYSSVKRQKTQNTKDALMDEIEAVNSRLIDTVISITNNDTEDGITSCNGVTVIKLSYTAVSLAPSLKSQFATSGYLQPLVMPMKLLIPADYPSSSPVIMDDEGDSRLRAKFSCISVAVDAAFRLALRNIHEPRSLKETARAWDSCVRRAITEYAYQLGGGTLSSSLIQCEGWVGMRQGECMGIGIE